MPKRPCALALTPDNSTLLVADKFGDVYSLPLHFTPSEDGGGPQVSEHRKSPEAFKPSATELTVHTKGNREALRQQQKMKAVKPQKVAPTFEHELILGHVSLLTDLAYVEMPTQDSNSTRPYLLTSDRDEHIRISRGPPQAHIIENYCLGHSKFISKLCILPHRPDILISGGGGDCLMSWDWRNGQLLGQVRISDQVGMTNRTVVKEFINHYRRNANDCTDISSEGDLKAETGPLSVSGIWPVSANKVSPIGGDAAGSIFVALEG